MVRKILSFIFLASLSSYCYAGAEQVTITTYYPAPYGVYKELRTDQMAVGSTYRNVNPLSDGNLIVSGNVGVGTNSPVPSAIFELSSTNKGFLLPRLTTAQRNNIVNPAFGLMVYNIETNAPEYWNGTQWISNQAFKQKMVSGLVSIPKGSYGYKEFTVSLPPGYFSKPPNVVIQPRWFKITGDEDSTWLVYNVTKDSFIVGVHTPKSGGFYGDNGVMWIAEGE